MTATIAFIKPTEAILASSHTEETNIDTVSALPDRQALLARPTGTFSNKFPSLREIIIEAIQIIHQLNKY